MLTEMKTRPVEIPEKQGLPKAMANGIYAFVRYYLPVLILIAIWQLLSSVGILNPKTMPSPIEVFKSVGILFSEGEIFKHLFTTVYRAEAGLILGAIAGITLGLLMARNKIVNELAYPTVALTYTMPKTALIPLVFLWLGVGNASNIFVAFIGALVPIVVSTYHGAERVETNLIWSAQSLGSSKTKILWTVVFPRSLPQILNGIRIAQAFSFVIVISAEMVASFVGIGRFIFVFGEAGNYNFMFAAIIIIVFAAFLLDQFVLFIRNKLLSWTDDSARAA